MAVHPTSEIHPKAIVSSSAFVDAYCVIGMGVVIEERVYIARGAKIYGKASIGAESYIGENCIIGHPNRARLQTMIQAQIPASENEGDMTILGKKCTIRANSIVYSGCVLADDCQTGHTVMIRENTHIGAHTLIGTNAVIDGTVDIGHNVSIQSGVYIPLHSKIGNHVFMGPFSKLTNDKYVMRKKVDLIGPVLDDYVSLGANAVIMPGIRLAQRTIVGAGAVVTKDTKEADIVIGNPATFYKKVPPEWAETFR